MKIDGTAIHYSYDGGGHRTHKGIIKEGILTHTYYAKGPEDNVIGIYEKLSQQGLTWSEQFLYGSSRIGYEMINSNLVNGISTSSETFEIDSIVFGSRLYELNNHLGNILAVINNKKVGIKIAFNTVNYFNPEVISASEYYSGGMQMPARHLSTGVQYQYGFNGKEKDKEVVQYDYGFRIYDPRLVRFKSVDPLTKEYPELTPFQFASNTPIQAIDLDGLEAWKVTRKWTPEFVDKYQNEVVSEMSKIKSINKRYTCEDFAITTLATFARNNGLPFKWETGAKSFDAEDLNYKDFNTFVKDIKMKTGAADFINDKNTTAVSPSKITLGTSVLHTTAGQKNPHHVSVVSGITHNSKNQTIGFSFYQGNFRGGILYDRALGSSNPDTWNYHGAFVQQGIYNLQSDTWSNNSLGTTTDNYSSSGQQLEYRNFNFINMNIKYKYRLTESIITTTSPTTMAPITTTIPVYERSGTEQPD